MLKLRIYLTLKTIDTLSIEEQYACATPLCILKSVQDVDTGTRFRLSELLLRVCLCLHTARMH